MTACCGPSRGLGRSQPVTTTGRGGTHPNDGMVELPGGTFAMGTADRWTYPDDGEGPVHEVTLAPFRIDATAVTNARFAEFVAATGYRTDAEQYEWAFVFAGLLPDDFEPTRGVAAAPWWRQVYGADWAHPEGPQSNVDDRVRPPGRARVVAGRERLLRTGPASGSRPRPSGSTPCAAGSMGRCSRGAATSNRAASTA